MEQEKLSSNCILKSNQYWRYCLWHNPNNAVFQANAKEAIEKKEGRSQSPTV